jgi:SAM-dependent methyltransferase
LDVQVGLAEQLPYPDASFDCALMAHSLEHCYEPVRALREAHRVLKPRGELVVTTPNTASLARVLFGSAWLAWDVPRHTVIFHRTQLMKVLTSVGFKRIEWRGSSSGSGFVDSALIVLRRRIGKGPRPGTGIPTLRRLAGALSVLTNWQPWPDEMQVVAIK